LNCEPAIDHVAKSPTQLQSCPAYGLTMSSTSTRLPRMLWAPIGLRALAYLRPYRVPLGTALGCAFISAVLSLVPALALRGIIDRLVHHSRSFGGVAALVGLAFAATILGSLVSVLQTYLTVSVSENVVATLRAQLFGRLLEQSIGYFTGQRGGEAISRILNDAGGIDNTMGPTLIGLFTNSILAIASLVVMAVLDWKLTVLSLLFGPMIAVLLRLGARGMFRARTVTQQHFADLTAFLHDALGLSGLMLVKSFAREPRERQLFAEVNSGLRDAEIHQQMVFSWFGVTFSILQAIGPALLLVAGGYLVIHHQIGLGGLVAFAVIAARFAGSVQAVANGGLAMLGSLALWERVFGVLDHEPDIRELPSARPLPLTEGSIRLERVSFTYPGQHRPALADISVDVRARSLTALVGPSGAGKTTLSQLIPRFHDPDAGRVLIDGFDIRDAKLESLGAVIGMVLQDSYLTHASLRENLRYGSPDASDDNILRACELANLSGVIDGLSDGLDTVVGERGHRLSGGEKQRVSIARAVLKDPPILILDEATSHLDTLSERLVQQAMNRLIGGRTSLVIAHRLSTVLGADLIIVLDGGRVVQSGRHDDLILEGGLYRRLYDSQFSQPSRAGNTGPSH
jgi:ATP-binding cassette subfamily B protein